MIDRAMHRRDFLGGLAAFGVVTNGILNFGDSVTNQLVNFGDMVTSNADITYLPFYMAHCL